MGAKRKYVYCVQKERDKDKWRMFVSAISDGYFEEKTTVKEFDSLSILPDVFKQMVLLYLASGCDGDTDFNFNGVGVEKLECNLREDEKWELWLRLYFDEKQDY